jgi:hypothetical protein
MLDLMVRENYEPRVEGPGARGPGPRLAERPAAAA